MQAVVKIEAGDPSHLEHLCRHVTRPALSNKRLSLSPDGKVVLELRTPIRDGTAHFVLRLAELRVAGGQAPHAAVAVTASNWATERLPRDRGCRLRLPHSIRHESTSRFVSRRGTKPSS